MDDANASSAQPRRPQLYQRRSVRVPVRVSGIDAEIDPATGGPCFLSVEESTSNLSEGGVFLPSDITMTPGRRVLVEIDLPDGTTVQALGAVAWRRHPAQARSGDRPAGMGIEFIGIRHHFARALHAFLESVEKTRRRRQPPTGESRDTLNVS